MALQTCNKELEAAQLIKCMGSKIDNALDLEEQIKAISNKVSRAFGALNVLVFSVKGGLNDPLQR